jgi:hypothetical protein
MSGLAVWLTYSDGCDQVRGKSGKLGNEWVPVTGTPRQPGHIKHRLFLRRVREGRVMGAGQEVEPGYVGS